MPFQTGTNHYQLTKYIVSAAGDTPYATIQSAINAANTAGIPAQVYIRPGSYTENLTLYTTINLEGADNAIVTIIGTHTPPLAGDITFTRIGFQSATDVMSSAGAGTAVLRFVRCRFIIADGYACNLANWTGDLRFRFCTEYATSVTSAIVNNATGTAPVIISYCSLGAGTSKTMTIIGAARIESSRIICPTSFGGAALSKCYGGCFFDGMVSVVGTAEVFINNSTISTGAATALTVTSTTPMTLANVVIRTSHATAIDGTGTVNFAETTFVDSKGLAGTIIEGLAGVVKTGEIYANTVLRMDMTGFYSWAAGGPYFDDTTLGTFQLLVGGTGYIRGKVVTWVAQNITGMTSGSTWFIYIDSTGTIGKSDSGTLTPAQRNALFVDKIVLFECLYDETTIGGAKLQHTVKENHPYNFQVSSSNFLHDTAGALIENSNNGANISAGSTGVKISIVGDDYLNDHGLDTTIAAGADKVFRKFYTNAAGKWAQYNNTDTFNGYWNSAGTPTALGAGRRCIYRLYVAKDNLNAATPIYIAILDIAHYGTLGAANTAISNDTPAKATAELFALELCQLGFIIFRESTGLIESIVISKTTLRSTTSTSGTNIAALVTTNTASFNGILSAADTNVQSALETIDDWGAGTTDKCLVVGNGTGVALGVLAVGGTGTILTGVAANDPTWTTATYPATIGIGEVLHGSAANVISGLAAGTTGKILRAVTSAAPAWTTSTFADTYTIGGILHASAANTVTALSTGTTGTILTGATGAAPAWTTATYPATIAKGEILHASAANVISALTAGTANYLLTANGAGNAVTWSNAIAATASHTFATGGYIGTATSAGNTLLLQAYDVDGASYTTFATLTANNTPTMDLAAAVTIAGQYIYRATGTDVPVTDGGTGASTFTQYGVMLGNAASALAVTAAGTTGQILRATSGANPGWSTATYPNTFNQGDILCATAANVVGVVAASASTGYVLTSTGASSAPTYQAVPAGITWSVITADQTAVVNNGYVCNKAGLLTITLPAASAVGTVLRVSGMNTDAGWKIAQGANQIIHYETQTTTTGAGGSLASIKMHDSVEMVCIVANLEWLVVGGTGNITVT